MAQAGDVHMYEFFRRTWDVEATKVNDKGQWSQQSALTGAPHHLVVLS